MICTDHKLNAFLSLSSIGKKVFILLESESINQPFYLNNDLKKLQWEFIEKKVFYKVVLLNSHA